MRANAARIPEATALVDSGRVITYAELTVEVDVACCIIAGLDLQRGDRVAVHATKRIETVVALLATMRLGLIGVPINPLLKGRQIGHILADSGARLLVAQPETLKTLASTVDAPLPALEHQIALTPTAGDDVVDSAAPLIHLNEDSASAALILYTSGSTANPKGVVLTRANLAHGAASVADYLGLDQNDRILALMPLSFDYGLNQVFSALIRGASIVLFDYLLPKGVISAIERYRITGLPAVPHLWNQLAQLEWPPLPYLRYITNTGGRMPVETTRLLAKKIPGTSIFLMYGFTEAFRSTWLHPSELSRRPDSIGKAVPYATVLVVDEHGQECAPGVTGELIHGGPLVALGYWNDKAATQGKFRPRYPSRSAQDSECFAWSGDLARRDEEGFLYFVSRREDMAKLHGFRVNPAEIEQAIGKSEQVRDVCVLCLPHPTLGQAAVAILAADEGHQANIEQHIRASLPRFMQPEHTVFVEQLPANANNKVDRTLLRMRYASCFESVHSAQLASRAGS